ncbi:MAG TPA: hypothetical protein DCW52_02130 [Gammaproteobacteria bacterium]|jgi:hypothetical protein|nr:hypothetical protein [Gammaproteobacteria bacterium]
MATHTGSEGTVKVGAAGSDTVIAEIRTFSIEESADTLETTAMGDTSRTYSPSLKNFTGSVDVFWDETDTSGQGALTVGAEVTLNFYPEGATSGDTYYGGSAIVTGRTINSSFDGLVEASLTIQGSGALTETTVS